jgi:hypothetical protein
MLNKVWIILVGITYPFLGSISRINDSWTIFHNHFASVLPYSRLGIQKPCGLFHIGLLELLHLGSWFPPLFNAHVVGHLIGSEVT